MSKKLLQSTYPFARRIGVNILFEFVDDENISTIFKVLNSLQNEEEYYVNMSGAWLLCECFIKKRQQSFNYIKSHCTNKFIINKAISKCRDSFRISKEDKEKLKQFKV